MDGDVVTKDLCPSKMLKIRHSLKLVYDGYDGDLVCSGLFILMYCSCSCS